MSRNFFLHQYKYHNEDMLHYFGDVCAPLGTYTFQIAQSEVIRHKKRIIKKRLQRYGQRKRGRTEVVMTDYVIHSDFRVWPMASPCYSDSGQLNAFTTLQSQRVSLNFSCCWIFTIFFYDDIWHKPQLNCCMYLFSSPCSICVLC